MYPLRMKADPPLQVRGVSDDVSIASDEDSSDDEGEGGGASFLSAKGGGASFLSAKAFSSFRAAEGFSSFRSAEGFSSFKRSASSGQDGTPAPGEPLVLTVHTLIVSLLSMLFTYM